MIFPGCLNPVFKRHLIQILLGVFLIALPLVSVHTAPAEVRKVVSRMAGLRVFRATVRFGSGGAMTSGILSFQHGKTHFKMSDGRVIAGNGRNLVIFSPSSGTAGKQSMVTGGGGLGWILSGFEYTIAGNRAIGKATNPDANVQEVQIVWGNGYMLRKLGVKNKGSTKWFTIALSNVRQVGGFPSSLFSFRPPSGSRTVENPLDQRN